MTCLLPIAASSPLTFLPNYNNSNINLIAESESYTSGCLTLLCFPSLHTLPIACSHAPSMMTLDSYFSSLLVQGWPTPPSSCLLDISIWITLSRLQFGSFRTKFIISFSPQIASVFSANYFREGQLLSINQKSQVILDNLLSSSASYKSCGFCLLNGSKRWPFSPISRANTLSQALIFSCLNDCLIVS